METFVPRVPPFRQPLGFPLSRKLIEWKRFLLKETTLFAAFGFPLSRKLIEWKRREKTRDIPSVFRLSS